MFAQIVFGHLSRSGKVTCTTQNRGTAVTCTCPLCSGVQRLPKGLAAQVNKRKGEKYKLIWKDKPDFVRMAAKSNALIIPFAAVGGDDAYDIAMDTDEVLANPLLGPLARRLTNQVFKGTTLEGSDDAVSPITKLPGLGLPSLVPLPKLERLYFRCTPALFMSAFL